MENEFYEYKHTKLNNSELNSKHFENKSLIFNTIEFTVNNLTIWHLMKEIIFISFLVYFFFTFSYSSLFIHNQNDEEYFRKTKIETYLKPKMVSKFNYYISTCLKGMLIDKTRYPLSKNPKISIIMPIYNGGKYLYYSLRSIQNQIMKDIEIILVDDFSPDDSIKIIEKYMEEDPRIRLIKNQENRKILFSKSFAALNSNGKYIMQLDQDDIFIREDAFDILFYEAENNNLDLVHIRDFVKPNFYFNKKTIINRPDDHLIFPQLMHYKHQPDLKDKNFSEKNNYLLWGLLIKSELYKKAIYHLWPIIINYKLIFHEDYTISFMLVILAKKYKYLNNFALIHLSHANAASGNHLNEDEYYLGILFFGNTYYDYYIRSNPEDIKSLLNYIFLYTNGFKLGSFLFPNFFDYIIRNILAINNKYLSVFDKEDLKIRFGINNDNYKIWNTYSYIMKENQFLKIQNFQNNPNNIINQFNNEIPSISIIIFCNEFKYLDKTIISIENQEFSSYEIFVVYDNNEESNLNLIKNYIKKYTNIKIIENNSIRGILYSISKGILASQGKYIMTLKSGITLSKEDVLAELDKEIQNDDIDLYEFTHLINNDINIYNNSLSLYRCTHMKTKIDLKMIKFNEKYIGVDQNKELLFNKLIKASLLKDLVIKYKIDKYNNLVYNYYDNILFFAINRYKPKFKYINIFGTIQFTDDVQNLDIDNILRNKEQKVIDSIFYIDFLFNNTGDNYNEKGYILSEFYNILNIIYNKYNIISEEANLLYQKFLNCPYINEFNKKKLEFYYTSLIN